MKRRTSDFYNEITAHASIHGRKIRPLEEVLGVESEQDGPAFDKKTDDFLERKAQENLEKMKRGQ